MRILFFKVTIDYKNTSLTKYQFDPSIIKVVPVLKIFTYSKPTIFLAYHRHCIYEGYSILNIL